MPHFPSQTLQQELTAALASFVAQTGPSPLTSMHLLLPSDRFFPDRYDQSVGAVEQLTARLLLYAGLGDEEFEVRLFLGDETEQESGASGISSNFVTSQKGALAFSGRSDGEAWRIHVAQLLLPEPVALTAALAREVARLYLIRHCPNFLGDPAEDSANDDDDDDTNDDGDDNLEISIERRVDIATVALGFGVFAVNGARMKTNYAVDAFVAEGVSIALGAIGQEATVWLLALQVALRGLDKKEQKEISAALADNPRADFLRALDVIYKEFPAASLREALGLPPSNQWPAARPLDELTQPLELDESSGDNVPQPMAMPVVDGGPDFTFRVRGTAVGLGTMVGALAGMAIAWAAHRAGLAAWPALGGLALVAGIALGKGAKRDACSDPDCASPLDLDDNKCPGCHKRIAGDIKHRDDRLAEAERITEKGAGAPR